MVRYKYETISMHKLMYFFNIKRIYGITYFDRGSEMEVSK